MGLPATLEGERRVSLLHALSPYLNREVGAALQPDEMELAARLQAAQLASLAVMGQEGYCSKAVPQARQQYLVVQSVS